MVIITRLEEEPLVRECTEITAMLTKKVLMLDKLLEHGSGPYLREDRESYDLADRMDDQPFPFLPEDYA